ncbi:MAG: hypothetical protein F6K47_40290 [Symploca sp. SIO2E6]|nr:hypothetical protein [Symploca sp. SIO2E6]
MCGMWVKFVYERKTYIVDLSQVSAFSCAENGRLMFCLPHTPIQIVIHPQKDPDSHQKILDYVENITGLSLDCDTCKTDL